MPVPSDVSPREVSPWYEPMHTLRYAMRVNGVSGTSLYVVGPSCALY